MGNSLLIYLNQRLSGENKLAKRTVEPGPVITISREVGCNGLVLARYVADRLNRHKLTADWRVLSKEVFFESAKELNIDAERVRKTVKQSDKNTFDEILNAFKDKSFKSERKIINTVSDVIRSFSMKGFCIIVGRAGHIIASDIKNALHLRLVAPIEYRINTIINNNKLSRDDAIRFINRVEEERAIFRRALCKNTTYVEMFDLTINRAKFNDTEIVDIVEYAVNKKKILQGYKSPVDFF
ncbi:MAG: hypothetical protein CSA36_03905 [Draconibacterium sp.]|nr:MAG: hypothetical protein CSA36_03905 [Draconibacterium sp.]